MAASADLPNTASGETLREISRWAAAGAGAVAVAVTLGVAELAAGLIAAAASPVIAVGDTVIDLVPGWLKDLAIALFGQSDKAALIMGMLLVALGAGALVGAAARKRFAVAVGAFAVFGLVGVAAATEDPRASLGASALVVAIGAAVGLAALRWLLATGPSQAVQYSAGGRRPDRAGRRRFLRLAGSGLVLAGLGAVSGRWLRTRTVAALSRERLAVPAVARTAVAEPAGSDLGIAGLEPFTTPAADFYRIDTSLSPPRVDVETWRLKVTGMVDRPLSWSFDDLVGQGLEEHWTTLCCVSNEVGGRLISNARWGGVLLRDVLDLAGVQVGATQIVGRSVDGWTGGFPTAVAQDGRPAMIAVTMNGDPLPVAHGFPARLVVPGLYGYVSATKWLSEIQLTTWEDFDGYWVPRGWSKEGPVKTQSRIDVPRPGTVKPGKVAVAGVAWAQQRGIDRVEVQVDDGPWNEARLGEVPTIDTWRQWVWEWDATPGSHVLQVRATDADGATQTAERRPVQPDGATGYHRVLVQVTAT